MIQLPMHLIHQAGARYAPVAGLPLMQQLVKRNLAGGYHLWLAHDVFENPGEWYDLAQDIRHRENNVFIIMDNSLIELGTSASPEVVLKAATETCANCLVLPDVLGDAAATIDEAERFLDEVRGREAWRILYDRIPHKMGVLQGETLDEVFKCGKFFLRYGCTMLSVPRIMYYKFGSRIDLTAEVWGKFHVPIHLLGFSENMADDLLTVAANREAVTGIDSAQPIWMGLFNQWMGDRMHSYQGKRPEDYFSHQAWLDHTSLSNIGLVRKVVER